jgi:hypothetical protein
MLTKTNTLQSKRSSRHNKLIYKETKHNPKTTIWTKSEYWYQHSICDIGWHSPVFRNFPFSEILHQTSQKICFKINSSVRGCPPNFISFLARQILHTVKLRISQYMDPFKVLAFQLRQPSSIRSSQLVTGFDMNSLTIVSNLNN